MSEDCPHCIYNELEENCRGCWEGSNYKPEPKTNADRIRSMSNEELAVFLYGLVNEFGSMNHDCLDFNYCIINSGEYRYNGWLDWLRQKCAEAEEDDNGV